MRLPVTSSLRAILLCLLVLASLVIWYGIQSEEKTLEIRASQQGISMLDGFYVWHHLDSRGINFKSITPKNNTLLITFDSSAQREAAKTVLYQTLPQGYFIARQEGDNNDLSWLSRLRTQYLWVG